jgi:hypothetical protein
VTIHYTGLPAFLRRVSNALAHTDVTVGIWPASYTIRDQPRVAPRASGWLADRWRATVAGNEPAPVQVKSRPGEP